MSSVLSQPAGFKSYPLSALFASESNVRKSRCPDAIKRMALSIAAHGGLLQNLVVVPEVKDGRPTGRAGVAAGETRRLALCLLRDGGVPDVEGFTDDFPVPVIEVPEEEGIAASASENLQREAMHPADQFVAYQTLFDQCGSVEWVAAFFGVTELMVRQRLKLASASPRLFEVYRQNQMTLEQLMALCVTDDHEAQERVWKATKGRQWEREPEALRRLLTEREISTGSPVALFVGLKAYEAAGGPVRRDLFGGEDEGFVVDVELLRRLADEKLDKVAQPVRAEGWRWVEVRADVAGNFLYGFSRACQGRRALTDPEQAELTRLESEAAVLGEQVDALYDQDDDESAEAGAIEDLEKRQRALNQQVGRLEQKYAAWTPDVLSYAGAMVCLERNGKVSVHRGLVRPEDRKAAKQAETAATKARLGSTPASAAVATEAGHAKDGVSDALARRLTAHRTVALQRALADNTQVALAALAHNLLQRMLDQVRPVTALDLSARGCEHQLATCGESAIQECRAWVELQGLRGQWGERIPGDQDKLLPWLIALPIEQLCDLLALCAAWTVNGVSTGGKGHPSDALAEAVGLDMAEWWEATGEEYLSRVSKAMIASAVTEAGMADESVLLGKLKKGEAVAKAEALLAGKRWLPALLRMHL